MNNIQCEIIDYFKKQNDNLILLFIEEFFPFNLSTLLTEDHNEYKKKLEEKYEIEIMISTSNHDKKVLTMKKLNKKTNGYHYLSLIISNENGINTIEYDGYNCIRKNVYETIEASLIKESVFILFRELNQNKNVRIYRNKSKNYIFYDQDKDDNEKYNKFINLCKVYNAISKEFKNDIINFILFNIKPLYTKESKDSLKLLYDIDIEKTLIKNKYTHIMRKDM